MKVGKRQQQGRSENTKKREVCPKCQVEYLGSIYCKKMGKWVKVGKYCPNDECEYCRKDIVENKEIK